MALLIAVSSTTTSSTHTTAGAQRPPYPVAPRPATRWTTAGADGGVVPAAPLPRPPSPPIVVQLPQPAPPATVTVSYVGGIPAVALAAYRDAAAELARSQPGCHLPVALLAAIGKVESGHAEGGRVTANGTAVPPILGPVLNGSNGFAAIPDTDNGVLDGDPVWDRAVGPMQFIPSTWRAWASDGNHDGIADPENIYDAGLAAARYLCADGRDLATAAGLQSAILSYNDSVAYLNLVSAWLTAYQGGVTEVADVSPPATSTPITPAPPPTPAPTTTPVPITTTAPTPIPPPSSTVPTPPVPPTEPTTTPPTTPPGQSLLCGLQDTLGGLGSLLGLTPPPQACVGPTAQPSSPDPTN
jgi:hypothetical protein